MPVTSNKSSNQSPYLDRPKFGTPPATVVDWLNDFIVDTQSARHFSLNPFERIWFRGRVSGLRDALQLLTYEYQQDMVTAVEGSRARLPLPVKLSGTGK